MDACRQCDPVSPVALPTKSPSRALLTDPGLTQSHAVVAADVSAGGRTCGGGTCRESWTDMECGIRLGAVGLAHDAESTNTRNVLIAAGADTIVERRTDAAGRLGMICSAMRESDG